MPVLWIAWMLASDPAAEIAVDRPVPELLTGRAFTAELEATVPGAVWQGIELRRVLRRLAADRKLSVLLDRRIDPNQPVSLEISQQRVAGVLHELATVAAAELSVAGNTVYLGPPAAARRLRTVIELCAADLRQAAAGLPRERRGLVFERRTVHWNDLDEPREIVERTAAAYGVEIVNPEAVPHDLWAGATLPYASLPEALSLVLVQFDLSYRWSDDGRGIELVPLPNHVAIEKTYRPRGMSAEDAAGRWTRELDGLDAVARNGRVVVRGTVEQHEAIARIVAGRGADVRAPADPRPAAPRPIPLAKRTFTIRQKVTAAGLIATLEKSGVEVEYDKSALEAAGVDLESVVTLDLTRASAEEFFRAWCQPLGLGFRIDGVTVTLSPR